MSLPFERDADTGPDVRAMKLPGTVMGLFKAEGKGFVTTPVEELPLTFEGIPGDAHAGHTRRSGGREPWYKRGTEMVNERQVSLLCADEMRLIARRLQVPEVKAEWIGGNFLLSGINRFSFLPPRTTLFFEGGVTIRLDGDNAPCRLSGRSIAGQYEGRDDIEMAFAKVAQGMRGLVGFVEVPGVIRTGEAFEARVPAQRLYRP
ncbi:MAG: molybdenum cofactor sulfurase [Pseudomonadota bacterium]